MILSAVACCLISEGTGIESLVTFHMETGRKSTRTGNEQMWVSPSVTGSDGAEQGLIGAAISLRACVRVDEPIEMRREKGSVTCM